MGKRAVRIYDINNLNDTQVSVKDFHADTFTHYLDVHSNLKFPHKHTFYQLVYFSSGSGSHSIDFISFPLLPYQIYFMKPGQVHSWSFDDRPEGYIVNFSEQYINALLSNARYLEQFSFFSGNAEKQVIGIPVSETKEVIQILQSIVSEGISEKAYKDDLIRTSLIQLFILVSRIAGDKTEFHKSNYNHVVFRTFQELIDKHFKEKKLTKDYASILYVTPNHLNALTKEITGSPAGDLIRKRILLEAKRLLVNAELTISEIADELNFTDNSYFTKFFKKYEQVTPEIFRKTIQ